MAAHIDLGHGKGLPRQVKADISEPGDGKDLPAPALVSPIIAKQPRSVSHNLLSYARSHNRKLAEAQLRVITNSSWCLHLRVKNKRQDTEETFELQVQVRMWRCLKGR